MVATPPVSPAICQVEFLVKVLMRRLECPVISEVEKETEEVNGFWMTGKFARQDLQMLL